jgi:hypothetical protein
MRSLQISRIRKEWLELLKVLDMSVTAFVEEFTPTKSLSRAQELDLERLLEEAGRNTMHELFRAVSLQNGVGVLTADEVYDAYRIIEKSQRGSVLPAFLDVYTALVEDYDEKRKATKKNRKRR